MGKSTYAVRAVVLRKTKLGEADLILTLLADDGQQRRVVAKGARKPSSQFASRLELYSEVDLLLVHGRTLDIVKEARLVSGNDALRCSLELSACAAPGAELLAKVSQDGLEHERLFLLARKAFAAIAQADADHALAMSAALLLKIMSFAGFKPCFGQCVNCGNSIDVFSSPCSVSFSCSEGGSLCGECGFASDAVLLPSGILAWSDALLMSTFAQIADMPVDRDASYGVLRVCQQWIGSHVGGNMKSLDFLFKMGL